MAETHWTCLFPVVLKVPFHLQQIRGREKVTALSAAARRALAASAILSRVDLPPLLEKDDRGAPCPVGSIHWSLTHKSAWVAAVVAPGPAGIDLETIRPFHPGLPRKVATEEEWRLADGDRNRLLFRYWTAKEAVLKASGTGLRGLDHCRVVSVQGPGCTVVRFEKRSWTVYHLYFDGQVVAMTAPGGPIRWTVLDLPDPLP